MAELTCPSCHSAVNPGAKYCLSCGAKLATAASPGTPTCPRHPDIAATQTCPRCGSFACAQCLVARPSGEVWCVDCNARQPEDALPWDRRAELGTIKAWWKTCLQLMQSPTQSFATAPQDASFGSSALFALLSAVCGLATTMLVYVVGGALVPRLAALSGEKASSDMPTWLIPLIFAVYGVVAPFIQVVSVIIIAAIDHLMLMIVGAKPANWSVTFRAAALSMAPFVIGLVPVCGLYIYPIWSLVLKVFAYRGMHRTTGGKAAAAVLIPPVAIVVCCGGMYAVILATALSAAGR